MAHLVEPATSARAKCRGCGQRIEKNALRVGERLPNAFGEGDMTLWFHLACAAHKRPEVFLEAVRSATGLGDTAALDAVAQAGVQHPRLPRIDGVQRAPSGRAACRHCREPIDKGVWRISLVFYDEARFQPAGYIHARCARPYFQTADVLDRLRHFTPDLGTADIDEIRAELAHPPA